jgi:predicted aldo/keto reductase-like oxidoreductase
MAMQIDLLLLGFHSMPTLACPPWTQLGRCRWSQAQISSVSLGMHREEKIALKLKAYRNVDSHSSHSCTCLDILSHECNQFVATYVQLQS